MNIKYISNFRAEGLGSQFYTHSTLIKLVQNTDLKIIFNFKTNTSYFSDKYNEIEYDHKKIQNMFVFNDSIIHDPNIIDNIPNDQIYSICNPKDPGTFLEKIETIGLVMNDFGQRIKEPFPEVAYIEPFTARDPTILDKYRDKISDCTGVQARMGNGEAHTQDLDRLQIPAERFIQKMKRFPGKFFICTDSVEFLQVCKDTFPDRIIHQSRNMPLPGTGPGHRLMTYKLNTNITPYDSIRDAYIDMILLSYTKRLIYNKSTFSLYARSRISEQILVT